MSVEEIIDKIAASIKAHREREIGQQVRNSAFGCVNGILDNKEQTFWIVPDWNRVNDVLPDTGNDCSVTRDSIAGGILIQNYGGEYTYKVRGEYKGESYEHNIHIFNKATYTPIKDKNVLASGINIITNIPGDITIHRYNNLVDLLTNLNLVKKQIADTQEKLTTAEKEPQDTNIEHLRIKLAKEKEEQRLLLDKAQRFIRQNAELRWQPILDREQDTIKRMKIFDGGTLIINGGPGTGKTTALVQRIKFLTSSTIKEYYALNKKQEEILFHRKPSWIFFSPSKLLALFLKNNMAQEELSASDSTVKVWNKYRGDIVRLYGWLDEEKRIFSIKQEYGNLFVDAGGTREIIRKFNEYYLERHKEALQKISCQFELQRDEIQGKVKECIRQGEALNDEIIGIRQAMQALGEPNAKGDDEQISQYGKLQDRENLVSRRKDNTRERMIKLEQQKRILQNIIGKITDYISNNNHEITGLIRLYIEIGRIKDRENDSRVFDVAVNNIFTIIPSAYKTFRMMQSEQSSVSNGSWNHESLKNLVDNKNRDLHPDEQSLLIYTINRICYYSYQEYGSYFQDSKSVYIQTYMQCCKPVIAIDEATDFSLMDILAMRSFRHPALSSVTLSGDIMQRMTPSGLKSWDDFANCFKPPAQIENLTISYRQSPTLLTLAQKIYQHSTHKKAEYKSFMDRSESEPKPLIRISNAKHEKLRWIASRIREIDTAYRHSIGQLPSVAVFVPSEDDINDFVSDLDIILDGDIPVIGCPKGIVLGESSDVRVYAIDKIKGLEFEAVFFHDLDKLSTLDDNILLKYLYVGLSRATFYLGVTISKPMDSKLEFIQNEFVQDGDWRLFKDGNSKAEDGVTQHI